MSAAAALLERFPQTDAKRRMVRARSHSIPVPGGSIVSIEIPAVVPRRGLPLVYVPGWGGLISGFMETIRAVDPSIDLYYVETREKGSSRVARDASFSMSRIAADVALAVGRLGLRDGGYIVLGSSFGGAVVLQGVADGALRPACAVLYDPMRRLWVPRWMLHYVARLLPVGVIGALRPGLKRLVLAGMTERIQRLRAERFIDGADLRKWRSAALRLRDWDFAENADRVSSPTHLVHGSKDRFHDSSIYPVMAAGIPGSTYMRVPVCEADREHLIGAVGSAYALAFQEARTSGLDRSPPELLRPFILIE